MSLRQGKYTEFYEVQKEIGRGGFSVVLECVEKATKTPYAVKLIRKKIPPGRRGTSEKLIEREVSALRLAQGHNRLIQLVDAFTTSTEAALILEL
jgi:serine/threonine protein kinase